MSEHSAVTTIRAAARRRHPEMSVSMKAVEVADPALLDAYESKVRVKVVDTQTGWVRTGRVGASRGWAPILLLIHRSNEFASSDVLGPHDRVVAWWDGRKYYSLDGTPAGASLARRREEKENA